MVKLNFSTDFTSFLKEENKIFHTIKVVTKTEVIECSGAVLCQHSEVLKELFTKENELFLDNYTYVQDCLLILHGDEVVVTMDNILDLLKFSVQFGINDMYMQVLNSMERYLSAENVMKIYSICNSVFKFARLCGTQLPQDIFTHVVTYLKMIGPEALMDLHKANIENDTDDVRIDFLTFLTGPRSILTTFAPFLTDVLCKDNVKKVIFLLSNNLEGMSRLSESNFRILLDRIDTIVYDCNCHEVAESYVDLKAKLFSLYLKAELPSVMPSFIPERTCNLVDAIVKEQLWIEMDSSVLINSQKLFEPPSLHFIYSEIIIAWITLKKPSQDVVDELIQAIVPYKLGVDYMMMMNNKLEALGYELIISSTLLDKWFHPSHYLSDFQFQCNYGAGFAVQFKISCRNNCNNNGSYFSAWFNQPSNNLCKELAWGWYNYTPPTTVTDDFLRCPEDPATETGKKKGPIKFFGATKNSVHLQFHTDWSDALSKWREGGCLVEIGCVQFDEK